MFKYYKLLNGLYLKGRRQKGKTYKNGKQDIL